MNDIVLALGGGGVKGIAHIGVIRVLEAAGYRIRAVAGTSAGGICAAFYAFGYSPDEIQAIYQEANQNQLFLRHPEDKASWLGLRGVRQILEERLGDSCFEYLRLPAAVTAVDLNRAEHLVIRRGRVVEAVMATIAVPGVFPPQEWDGHLLVDGGILDPVPVEAARALAPGLPVVAVVLSPPLGEWSELTPPRLLNSLPFLMKYITQFRFSQALNIFMRSIDIAGALLTETLLEVQQPEVIIRPAVRQIGLLDVVEVDEVVRLGERAALAALPSLRRATGWWPNLKRRLGWSARRNARLPYRTLYL